MTLVTVNLIQLSRDILLINVTIVLGNSEVCVWKTSCSCKKRVKKEDSGGGRCLLLHPCTKNNPSTAGL